jgi:ribonuclease-3
MNENFSPEDLEKLIGYRFQNRVILDAALTRRAYVNEHPDTKECMDLLATVGDAILDSVAAYRLYEGGTRDPGKLTTERSEEVKRGKTRRFAEKNHLGDFVNWGKGEKQDDVGAKGTKAYDAVTEALIAAVFLDAQEHGLNGIEEVGKMLDKLNFLFIPAGKK